MDYNLTLITPPVVEPVALDDMKAYLRVDFPDDDTLISAYTSTAREMCEGYQNRAYITQTWEMALSGFPIDSVDHVDDYKRTSIIEIPKGRLQTINSFTYKDTAGVVTTLTPDVDYDVSNRGILGRVCPPFGKIFPLTILYPLDPVVIQFTCGYGDTADKVPNKVKQAIQLLVSHWYQNREAVSVLVTRSAGSELPFGVKALLSIDRIILT